MVSRIKNLFRLAFTPRYAMLSNTVSCVVLLGAADATEQCVMGKQIKELDWKRICRVAVIGVALGPMNTVWYQILQKYVKLSSPARMAVTKAFLDLGCSPAFDGTFIVGVALLEGKTFGEAWAEYVSKGQIIFAMSSLWIPVQFFNFRFVPSQYQPFVMESVAYFYNGFLTYMKHEK